jgi:hypothetical protein
MKRYKKFFKESSLSRLWNHNIKHDCGAITAFRKYDDDINSDGHLLSKKEKMQRNISLRAKLKSKGYGVTEVLGKYPEGGIEGKEISYFVVDLQDEKNLLFDLIKFGTYFNQDSILFIPKGAINNTGEKAFLYGTNYDSNNFLSFGKKLIFNKGYLGKDSPIYTSFVNGRPFIFESVGNKIDSPGSGMGIWSMHISAQKNWREIECDGYLNQYSKKEYGNALFESSLSRVWQHAKRSFFMMSAFRGNDFEKNIENHNHLKADLKKFNLGFFEIDGVYKYDDGTTSNELSIFVPYRNIYTIEEFKKIASQLGEKYNQESILFKYPHEEGKGETILIYSNKEISIGHDIGYDKISSAYSKLRNSKQAGRSFIIEGVRIPTNHISAYGFQAENILF